jgi:hypothetical protein
VPRVSKDNRPDPPEGYVYSDEAGRRLGLSVKTLWNYRHLGKGPKPKRWRGWLVYRIDAIEAHKRAELEALEADEEERAHESRPPEPRLSRQPARVAA